MMEIKNKTQAMVIEDLKNDILEKLSGEEFSLWHGSTGAEAGWNKALERAREIIRFEV